MPAGLEHDDVHVRAVFRGCFEAISVGDIQYTLPHRLYVARAIEDRNRSRGGHRRDDITFSSTINCCLPMVAWADKFRFDQQAAASPRSWFSTCFDAVNGALGQGRWGAPARCLYMRLPFPPSVSIGRAPTLRGWRLRVVPLCSP